MNALGKRDYSSRQQEIKTSVIGTIGRVAQNSKFDVTELDNRKFRKKAHRCLLYDESRIPITGEINSKTVACVVETEPAYFYKPNVPKDRKLIGNMGRLPTVATAINGLTIECPENTTVDGFQHFPEEVKHEFFLKKFDFKGLITTNWQMGSDLASVTHNKFPVTKEGTAMPHVMYPTVILAGDTITATFPTEYDIKNRADIPRKESDKLLLALKPMREVIALHDTAIKLVLDKAKKLHADAVTKALGIANPLVLDHLSSTLTQERDKLRTKKNFDYYILNVMTTPRDNTWIDDHSTTPFKILYGALLAADEARGAANTFPVCADFTSIEKAAKGYAKITNALFDRQQLLQSYRVGIALTPATAGGPVDVIVGR
jgi:hypothetical protein